MKSISVCCDIKHVTLQSQWSRVGGCSWLVASLILGHCKRKNKTKKTLFKVNNITLALIWKCQLSIKACCNTGYPSETRLKLKSREISFAHNVLISCQIALKICTGHGSITAVLCVNFQNDLITETDVMDERDFTRFEFWTDVPYCNSPVHIYYICYTHHRYTTDTCYKTLNRS